MSEPSATEITEPCLYCKAAPEHCESVRSVWSPGVGYFVECSTCGSRWPRKEIEAQAIQERNGGKPDDQPCEDNRVCHPCGTLRDAIWEKSEGKQDHAAHLIRELLYHSDLTTSGLFEVLIGIAPVRYGLANALETVLGIPAGFWMNLQKQFDAGVAAGKEPIR